MRLVFDVTVGMKKILVIAALVVVAAFPPCDHVNVIAGRTLGNATYETETFIESEGFKPLWEVGGKTQIRWPQLGMELGVVAVAGFLVLANKKAP